MTFLNSSFFQFFRILKIRMLWNIWIHSSDMHEKKKVKTIFFDHKNYIVFHTSIFFPSPWTIILIRSSNFSKELILQKPIYIAWIRVRYRINHRASYLQNVRWIFTLCSAAINYNHAHLLLRIFSRNRHFHLIWMKIKIILRP